MSGTSGQYNKSDGTPFKQSASSAEMNLPEMPPKLPGTQEALQRAILLLGNRTKSHLGNKPRQELESLIGAYPSAEQAILWKQNLKQLVKSTK